MRRLAVAEARPPLAPALFSGFLPFLLLLVLGGCSGDDGRHSADSGAGDGGTGEDAFVTPPAPVTVACPEGWSQSAEDEGAPGATHCEPWAAGAETRCPAGQAYFPGAASCEAVGPPCPAGDLPDDLPPGRTVLFVSTSAGTVGRDGSRERPFRDLSEAFAAASGGELMVLSKGRHEVGGVFPEDVEIWGTCAAETELAASFIDEATGTVTAIEGAEVSLERLTIVGAQPGLRVDTGASLSVRDVIVRGSGLAGAWVLDGTFTAENFVVRDAAPRDGQFGRGLQVQAGGRAEVRRAVFEGLHDVALQVVDSGSIAVLEDVAIRDVTPDEGADLGKGIEVRTGARVEATRVVIEEVRNSGLSLAGGELTATDLLVRGVRETRTGTFGRGLHVEAGGRLTVTRGAVVDTRELGIYGSGGGSVLELTDVLVRGTRPRSADRLGGRGLQVQWGIAATFDRLHLADNVEVGLFVASEDTTVTARDLVVAGTVEAVEAGPTGRRLGHGVDVIEGAALTLERSRIRGNYDVGLYLGGPASLTDVEVSGTKHASETGWYGRGVVLGSAAEVTGDRLLVRGNYELGIFVQEGDLTMTQVRVEDTMAQPCLRDCGGQTAGVGLLVLGGGAATLTDVELTDNALAGLVLSGSGRARLTGGVISGHPVAVFTSEDPAQAVEDLVGVELRDNMRNFDARTLPIPDRAVPPELGL